MEELINLGGKVFIQIARPGAIQETDRHGRRGDSDRRRPRRGNDPLRPEEVSGGVGLPCRRRLAAAARKAGSTVHGHHPHDRRLLRIPAIEAYVEKYHDLGVPSVEQEVAAIPTIAPARAVAMPARRSRNRQSRDRRAQPQWRSGKPGGARVVRADPLRLDALLALETELL
jgi:hypothetical protein